MQTFLPYPNFALSAQALDWQRLGKQRVEAAQILQSLRSGLSGGWSRHPAVVMWRDCELALELYHDCCLREWERRGYRNSMPYRFSLAKKDEIVWPWWLGIPEFHASHRSALLHKNPDYYARHEWPDEPRLDYWWPTEEKRLARVHT